MTALDSHLFLRAIVDELARCGMQHACTSPGSRNTPIVLTLAAESRLRTWSHVDERAAGFFAVGLARATRLPVAITCTSGTAAANLLPAVIEAHEAGLPLIVLTADRPPELRDVGAGQTIDQVKLYGDAVKWFFDVGVPEATAEHLRWARSLACRCYWTALDGRPGPVHLNVPLREPLVLDQPLPDSEPGGGGHEDGTPWVMQERTAGGSDELPRTHRFKRMVFVAGDLGGDPVLGRRLAEVADRASVPLLADPLSNARSGAAAIAHYDLILRASGQAAALKPDLVCRIGELPTSKPLRAWIAGLNDVEHVAYSGPGRWSDPAARVRWRSVGPLAELLARIEDKRLDPADPSWLESWRQADLRVREAIAKPLRDSGLSEPVVAATLGELLPSGSTLFVAASMPIRDVEEFVAVRQDPPRILANRGANGIDGTVSSALGVAAAERGEVVLLIGDVALAHDLGGLLAGHRCGLKLTVVLINNGGGGIFDFLPVRDRAEPATFERHIATPTGLQFERAAELFGFDYTRPAGRAAFRVAVERALAGSASTLIEVRTDRAANRRLHAEIELAAVQGLATTAENP